MKRIILILVLLMISYCFCDEFLIGKGNCQRYNSGNSSFYEDYYTLRLDDTYMMYYIVIHNNEYEITIHINGLEINTLRKNLEKYFEWYSIAAENDATVMKELPNSGISSFLSFMNGKKIKLTSMFQLSFYFFSQNILWHQLVICSDDIPILGTENEYIELDKIYLDFNAAKLLFDLISEDNVTLTKKEYYDNKKKSELFN